MALLKKKKKKETTGCHKRGRWLYQFNLKEEPRMEHSSLLKKIPSIFHPYITYIQNVKGDGNFGFLSAVVYLGYDENEWFVIRH